MSVDNLCVVCAGGMLTCHTHIAGSCRRLFFSSLRQQHSIVRATYSWPDIDDAVHLTDSIDVSVVTSLVKVSAEVAERATELQVSAPIYFDRRQQLAFRSFMWATYM